MEKVSDELYRAASELNRRKRDHHNWLKYAQIDKRR